MKEFRIRSDGKVFLNGEEIKNVLGFKIKADAGENPEVVLRVPVEKIVIEGYTDFYSDEWQRG